MVPPRSPRAASAKALPPTGSPKRARALTPPATESLYVRLGFLIHDVSRLRRSAFDRLMRPLGVTRSQWWVLAYLSRRDGMMQTELAETLDVGKVTLGGLIDRLEAGGWVVRRADKNDRRVKRIFLMARTDKLFRQMRMAENKLSDMLLEGVSEEECDKLFNVLLRMKKNLTQFGAQTPENGRDFEDDE